MDMPSLSCLNSEQLLLLTSDGRSLQLSVILSFDIYLELMSSEFLQYYYIKCQQVQMVIVLLLQVRLRKKCSYLVTSNFFLPNLNFNIRNGRYPHQHNYIFCTLPGST